MKQDKQDRRSQRTRQVLRDALIALMGAKRYDLITVQDILDQANVGRSTFYAHYYDKEDLLVSEFERMLATLSQHIGASGGQLLPSLGLFRHVQAHQHLYKALLQGRGVELLFQKGHTFMSNRVAEQITALQAQGQTPTVPVPIMADYLAGALLNLLRWWLSHDLPYTPEEMDRFFQRLALPGALATLGVEQES
jgi:AcrR family transcriptional regulator